MRRHLKTVMGLLASSAGLLFCQTAAFAEAASLKIYTARHYPADLEIYEAFKKEHGITIESVLIKNTAQLVERVLAEKEKPQADMVITTDVGQIVRLAESGALDAIGSKTIQELVPAALRDEVKDLWTAFTLRARVIAYRKSKVQPSEVASIEALEDEKWAGRLLVRSSGHVYNQSLGATLLAVHGDDGFRKWAQAVTRNLARKPQGGDTDQLKAIAIGEGDVAIVNSYYAGRLAGSDDKRDKSIMDEVGIVYPNQDGRGAHVNGSALGVLKGSKNADKAKLFAEFLVTEKSQKTLTAVSKEFPVRQDVKPDSSLGDVASVKFDLEGLKTIHPNTAKAVSVLDEVGWR